MEVNRGRRWRKVGCERSGGCAEWKKVYARMEVEGGGGRWRYLCQIASIRQSARRGEFALEFAPTSFSLPPPSPSLLARYHYIPLLHLLHHLLLLLFQRRRRGQG